jgi:hypothetical protein
MKQAKIVDCELIHLPKVTAHAGSITSLNNSMDVLFDVKRVFYIYDIPSGESRGAHAHRICHQLLIATSGSFKVSVFDGAEFFEFILDRPDIGLYIPPGIWASEFDFSGGGICLVLASHEYDEGDYIRDYKNFLAWKSR